MKVSIIGHGFVGKALENGLKDAEILVIDPLYNNQISDLNAFKPDYLFICVPTPMTYEGDQDLQILSNVINDIKKINLDTEIILKSTVLPNKIKDIEALIPNIIYNPEFLTENNAFDDFINADLIVLGGNNQNLKKISSFYKTNTKCVTKNIIHTDLISASLIKYTINLLSN